MITRTLFIGLAWLALLSGSAAAWAYAYRVWHDVGAQIEWQRAVVARCAPRPHYHWPPHAIRASKRGMP